MVRLTGDKLFISSLWTRVFPELGRFPDSATRIQAWHRTVGRPSSWDLVPLAAAVWMIGLLLHGALKNNHWLLACLSVAMVPCIVLLYRITSVMMRRRHIQRRLREILREHGIPICIGCGYDFRGNESGICPECGTTRHVETIA